MEAMGVVAAATGQHDQGQGPLPACLEPFAVIPKEREVAIQGPAVVSPVLGPPEPQKCLLAGGSTEVGPAALLGGRRIQPQIAELAESHQFGRLGAGVRGKPTAQIFQRYGLQAQPAAVEQEHRQAAMEPIGLHQGGELALGQLAVLLQGQRIGAVEGVNHGPHGR